MSATDVKFIEWIDALPPTWGAKRLGSIATVKARLGWKGLKAEEYVDIGYIFLSTPNLKGEEIDFENVNYITKARYDESPEIMLRVGDVLMVKDGATLGIVALVKNLPAPATLNGSTAVIRTKKECDSRFLCHWLRSHGVQQLIDKMKGGMGVPHLFQSDLRRFPVALPPPDKQKRIAAYLDEATAKVDRLINLRERQMELLQEQRAALIQQAVMRGLNPRASIKDSGLPWLGQIPEHWNKPIRLKYVSTLKGRLGWQGLKADEYRDEGPYVVSSAHFDNFRILWDQCPRVTQERYELDSNIQLREGDLLLMKDGAALGKLAFVDTLPGPACLNSHLLLLRPIQIDDELSYYPQFLFCLMQTSLFQEQIKLNATGTTFFGVSQEAIGELRVALPPLDEQEVILAYIQRETAKLDGLHRSYARQIELLTEYRAALIHECVTGQREIPQPVVWFVNESVTGTNAHQSVAGPRVANVHFQRAVLGAEIIHRLHDDAKFGRVKLEKIIYLAEAFAGMDVQGHYQRAAHGPFDNRALRSVESQIQKSKWYQPVKHDKGTRYVPLAKAGAHQPYFEKYWPTQRANFERLIALLRPLPTENCEMIATLFAVWKDSLAAKQPFTDDSLVDEVLTNWHPNKQKIPRERWEKGLDWMRKNNLIPAAVP